MREFFRRKMTRRNAIRLAVCSVPAVCLIDGFLVEPEWTVVKRVQIGEARGTHRIVHFTDLHYKGDRAYLSKVVRKINQLSPDCACFTGDIVEDIQYLGEALELLSGVCCPMFGVPGNWEYLSGATFSDIAACFESTGGAWLVDEEVTTGKGQISIFGATGNWPGIARTEVDKKRLLLVHYPAFADELEGQRFDLILAGHSHGGQARIPFIGALILPDRVGEYERGLYETGAGPLYVNPGIGTWYLPVRFCCRPEITLVEF